MGRLSSAPTLRRRLAADIIWPEGTAIDGEVRAALINNTWEERFLINADDGLIDREVRIDGLLGGGDACHEV